MCGLAGFLKPGGAADEYLRREMSAMIAAIAHRGPDGKGVWSDAASGVVLGHRRLSIIDLSGEGAQPMASASGRYTIVYNGEIYNFRELKQELIAQGIDKFRGGSDTEVLLACLEKWGLEDTLRRANGMFAMAIWDATQRHLILARDRFGQKPLMYGWNAGAFLFGSELNALAAYSGFSAEIEPAAVALLLTYGNVPAPWSIRAGLRKLPPGCFLRLSGDAEPSHMPEPQAYWSAAEAAEAGLADKFSGSFDEATDELDALLRDAVRLCLVADVPVGAFLSGGIDSSVIVAMMQSLGGAPVRSFSIGFDKPEFDEAPHARSVAKHLGANHTELYLGETDILATVPLLGKMFDEPFADSSQMPTYLVSRLARQSVTVSLSGDAGDELFGGYSRYALAKKLGEAINLLPRSLLTLSLDAVEALPAAWLNRLGPFFGDRAHKFSTVLRSGNIRDVYRNLLRQSNGGNKESADLRDQPERWLALDDPRHMMMLLDTQTYLPDDILVKLDRASMAVGLESRVPLLDHRIYEFAWRLPLHFKFGAPSHGGSFGGKSILRRVLNRYVPANMVERPKMGFGVPLEHWLRGPLRDWAESLLSHHALGETGLLDVKAIRRQWDEHQRGERRWQYSLWCVLMFQAWREARQ